MGGLGTVRVGRRGNSSSFSSSLLDGPRAVDQMREMLFIFIISFCIPFVRSLSIDPLVGSGGCRGTSSVLVRHHERQQASQNGGDTPSWIPRLGMVIGNAQAQTLVGQKPSRRCDHTNCRWLKWIIGGKHQSSMILSASIRRIRRTCQNVMPFQNIGLTGYSFNVWHRRLLYEFVFLCQPFVSSSSGHLLGIYVGWIKDQMPCSIHGPVAQPYTFLSVFLLGPPFASFNPNRLHY